MKQALRQVMPIVAAALVGLVVAVGAAVVSSQATAPEWKPGQPLPSIIYPVNQP